MYLFVIFSILSAHGPCPDINELRFEAMDADRVVLWPISFENTAEFSIQELVDMPGFTLTASNFPRITIRTINALKRYCQLKYNMCLDIISRSITPS
jgi:hypothetical protein